MGAAKTLQPSESEIVLAMIAKTVAGEVATVVLLNVKQAAIYLGRSEQSVQHLIFQRDIPVVRMGRRVHLHRSDLDAWIEKNKY